MKHFTFFAFFSSSSTSSSIFRKFSCFFSSCCSSSSSFRVLLSESYCFSEDLPAVLLRNLRSFSVKNIPYRVLFSTGFSQSFYLSFLFSRRCSSISAVLAFLSALLSHEERSSNIPEPSWSPLKLLQYSSKGQMPSPASRKGIRLFKPIVADFLSYAIRVRKTLYQRWFWIIIKADLRMPKYQ